MILGVFVVLSLVYMVMNVYKKNKGRFIFSSACFVFFIFVAIMVYLADYSTF